MYRTGTKLRLVSVQGPTNGLVTLGRITTRAGSLVPTKERRELHCPPQVHHQILVNCTVSDLYLELVHMCNIIFIHLQKVLATPERECKIHIQSKIKHR